MEKPNINAVDQIEKNMNKTGLRNVFIAEIVLAGIWIGVGTLLDDGTLMAFFNILFLLISIFILFSMYGFLKYWMPKLISLATALVIWILLFGLLRGLF